jgi:hypothetical protein
MKKTHPVSAGRYLLNTPAVLAAGRFLQNSLAEEDLDTLDYAVTQLSEAASSQGTGAKSYRAFMFTELKKTKAAQKEKSERIGEDVIATVLTDLQVANVLVGASHAIGEVDGNRRPEFLEQALTDLEQTAPAIAKELSSPLAKGRTSGRFNFAGTIFKERTFESPDPDSAVQTFEKVSNETLDQLVTGVHDVILGVIDALKKLSPESIEEALNQLGEPVKAITGMARRLISQGLEKMKQAIDDLTRLIGIKAIKRIKEKVEEIWTNREAGLVRKFLGELIGVETTRARIPTILRAKEIDKATVDQGSNDVARLLIPYNNNMLIAKKIVNAISFGSSILILTPIAGQKFALFAASSYLIVLATVTLTAMDYADSGRILQRVRGVGEIANSLRPSGDGRALAT